MKIVVVPRHRPAFFAILVAFLTILTPLYIGYTILSNTRSAAAGAPVCTWTGGGGSGNRNFSNASNWSCDEGTVPEDGSAIVFPSTVANRYAVNNLGPSVVFTDITFNGHDTECSGTTYPYVIEGDISLAGDFNDLYGPMCHTGANPVGSMNGSEVDGKITLYANATFNVSPYLNFYGGINIQNFTIDFFNNPNLTVGYEYRGIIGRYNGGSFNESFIGTGTVNLHDRGELWLGSPATNFAGSFVLDDSSRIIAGGQYWTAPTPFNTAFGSATVHLNDTASIDYYLYNNFVGSTITVPNNFTINSTGTAGEYPQINVNAADASLWQDSSINSVLGSSYSMRYKEYLAGKTLTFSGGFTLGENLKIRTSLQQVALTGALSGSGKTITNYHYANGAGTNGSVVVNGSSNTTATANTTLTPSHSTYSLDYNPSEAIYVGRGLNLNLNTHTVGNVLLQNGAILSGIGTTGNITVQESKIAMGNSPGVINSGNVSLNSSSSIDVELGGIAGGEFDQLNVTGTVSLGSATLNVSHWNDYIPANGNSFIIINNDSTDAVSGTFTGLAQGAEIEVGDVTYAISYVGGTGNDVVLTTLDSPGPPDTAGVLGAPTSLLLPIGIIFTALAALFLRRQFRRSRLATATVRKK